MPNVFYLAFLHESEILGNTVPGKGGEVLDLFSSKTRIISGAGSISFLEHLKAERVFLVTDPYFVKNGMAEKILKASGAEKQKIFSRVTS